MFEVEHVLDAGNQLGEGPIWDVRSEVLLWVDIEGYCFQSFCPHTRQLETVDIGMPVCALGLVADSQKLIIATDRGLGIWNKLEQSFGAIVPNPEQRGPNTRLNDGAVDRQGNFWVGSLGPDDEGALYRLGPGRALKKMDSGIRVSNGISWSPDNRLMYFTDSGRRVIYVYDFDASSSSIENRRVLVEVSEGEGVPDGLTVDREGFLWSAQWGGARVVRYDPTGRLEREIMLPVTYPTSCTFGGTHLDELYVTSARSALTEAQFVQEPKAGGLFRIRVGVQGFEEPRYCE